MKLNLATEEELPGTPELIGWTAQHILKSPMSTCSEPILAESPDLPEARSTTALRHLRRWRRQTKAGFSWDMLASTISLAAEYREERDLLIALRMWADVCQQQMAFQSNYEARCQTVPLSRAAG